MTGLRWESPWARWKGWLAVQMAVWLAVLSAGAKGGVWVGLSAALWVRRVVRWAGQRADLKVAQWAVPSVLQRGFVWVVLSESWLAAQRVSVRVEKKAAL